MLFALSRSAGNDVLSALSGRGVTPVQLAAALAIAVDEAAALLATREGTFTVAQAKRIESFFDVPFATLAMEGLYRRPAQTAAQLALLDSTAEIFADIDPTLAVDRTKRIVASASRTSRSKRRQRAS